MKAKWSGLMKPRWAAYDEEFGPQVALPGILESATPVCEPPILCKKESSCFSPQNMPHSISLGVCCNEAWSTQTVKAPTREVSGCSGPSCPHSCIWVLNAVGPTVLVTQNMTNPTCFLHLTEYVTTFDSWAKRDQHTERV